MTWTRRTIHTKLAIRASADIPRFRPFHSTPLHSMLFKIWAPRYMLGAASLQLIYAGLIIGLVAAGNVMGKVSVTFGSRF